MTNTDLVKRIEKIKQLRGKGYTYDKIADQLGISQTSVRANEKGKRSFNDRSVESLPECKIRRGDTSIICQRKDGHRGVHLSDVTGRLIYWE